MYVDDWGTTFRATCVRRISETKQEPIDLTGATVTFLFKKPSGTVVEVIATADRPTRGSAYYTVTLGFLDEVGVWQWQVRIDSALGSWHANMRDFTVAAHLAET